MVQKFSVYLPASERRHSQSSVLVLLVVMAAVAVTSGTYWTYSFSLA